MQLLVDLRDLHRFNAVFANYARNRGGEMQGDAKILKAVFDVAV